MKLIIVGVSISAFVFFAGCASQRPAQERPYALAKHVAGPHPLPAWARKLNPAASRAQATLDKRYTVSEREALVRKLNIQQSAAQDRIHFRFTQMPPPASLDSATARSTEEGHETLQAQNKVYDDFRRENHLTQTEMDALFQEVADSQRH